ncbi:Uncharacterized protein YxjI [Eubacterium ruminantium]|uniref:Uncharacterized protein YxjI n=2 Tax=Eubacterium ruminantium TaxID=42322 RepID=A0A1T4LQ29_9FIRM|nr:MULTISPECIES: hypothetical protein [Eubacterium]MCR5368441.1 hypothetical protein [Eubacterium sp.]SCW40549.1 Uncharacterized protein YxjI [Eubacterium ruminantium]SDM39074.1 Uncharacterized protein YxjI [Eubacterium ruminantium]SJZ56832.1 Uncharacterized protein YxjI [Eubacterium ruminantium]
MLRFFMKANEVEDHDSFNIYNDSGRICYYTKDDFMTTGHRIKIYMADTISEVAHVQEKAGNGEVRFEFSARGDTFGDIILNGGSDLDIDFENWRVEGSPFDWRYDVYMGSLRIMSARQTMYMIPGQALSMTNTYILGVANDSDALISIAFALAVYAAKKYR